MNQKGSIFPITLIVIMIALFTISQASLIFSAQYHYVDELRHFYKKEIEWKLIHGQEQMRTDLLRDQNELESKAQTTQD